MIRRALAPAKINLSLRVRARDATGLHPVEGLSLAIDHCDLLTMAPSEADLLRIHGADLPTGADNLVWKAIAALRSGSGEAPSVEVELWKRIPIASGLAGGSADAAASLVLYKDVISGPDDLEQTARLVGTDVNFCLRGGLRWVGGYGESLGPDLGWGEGFILVIVAPPIPMETPRVYTEWDRIGSPTGRSVPDGDVPPGIRRYGRLVNDLYPAAVSLVPVLDDWRADLERRWDRPVLMTGSGSTLFSFFHDVGEAREALAIVPAQARDAFIASPVTSGARLVIEDGADA